MHATALVIEGFDDTAHLITLDVPGPGPGQVLIRIEAASVNAFDWKVADGRLKDSFDYRFPVTIGRDYAGTVVDAGPGVERIRIGQRVFGYLSGQVLHRGAFASHILCAADECFVATPDELDSEVASCLPLCGVVATRCVAAVAPVKDDRVLVIGAPGGVGSFVVQLAAATGAQVIATGRPDDEEYLRDLGASEVLRPGVELADSVRERFPDGIDCLVDLVDYRTPFLQNAALLRHGGRAASTHRASDDALLAALGVQGTNVGSAPDATLLTRLGEQAAAGELRVPITHRYPLDDAVRALTDARDGHSRGRRVLTMTVD